MKGFRKELEENILGYWMDNMVDREEGGFYGKIDGHNRLHRQAPKGAVMNTRVLWTFSAAYRVLGGEQYREVADRAFAYIREYFIDKANGGVFWELDHRGQAINPKKQVYAQGFALYAFTEYYRATACREAMELSIQLFELIEKCKDKRFGGYWEAFTEDWQPIADMRLSDKDQNEAKTMNTHLHILEPYSNLLRIWKDDRLLQSQKELIRVFLYKIRSADSGHLQLFFDEKWECRSTILSYGHDIEAAWLLLEAVELVDDPDLRREVEEAVVRIVEAASEGLMVTGGVAYERSGEYLDKDRHWWVQAEAVVGFLYAEEIQPNRGYREKAAQVWDYIQQNIIDTENGEWYWSRRDDGTVNNIEDKAGFWKCPYHNSRMCLEMMEHFQLK